MGIAAGGRMVMTSPVLSDSQGRMQFLFEPTYYKVGGPPPRLHAPAPLWQAAFLQPVKGPTGIACTGRVRQAASLQLV